MIWNLESIVQRAAGKHEELVTLGVITPTVALADLLGHAVVVLTG